MNNQNSTMDQKIFTLGLSVEGTSLYLLCCHLADHGQAISNKNVSGPWNSTPQALEEAFLELEKAGVLKKILSDGQGHDAFRVMRSEEWKWVR